MWPWGHAATGYLLYAAYTRLRYDRPPDGPATLLLLFGTQLPDLIDKPLAWTLLVLPSGRSLGHSLLLLVPLVLIAAVVVRNRDTEWAIALAVGALSHAIVDVLPAALRGEFAYTTSLVWPLLPPPPYDEQGRTIIGQFLSLEPTPMLTFELVLALVAVAVWWRQGRPGIDTIRAVVVARDG
ncbi:metal-dependent hydrolase [Halalkalicoccus subterraneus]|uniref:metal-dependent hydrolase n=1 Tax=Halalkalicoccus subterraneus TaxID=2675002 RepID=UPI000EFBF01B|nr:metal-dependent hydrolase [Halalkalicoccus subterraneus]